MPQMPESLKKIAEDVEILRDRYFTYDLPVPFEGLTLYPVTVRNYTEFLSCSVCCSLNKNDDPMGITKTYLDYLLGKMEDEQEGPVWSMRFSRMLELCLHIKNGLKCPKCGKITSYEEVFNRLKDAETLEDKQKAFKCDCEEAADLDPVVKQEKDESGKHFVLVIDGHKIDNTKFNVMRKYILYQNLPDYKDDEWVNKELRDDQALRAEILSRSSGKATLERKILGICANTSYTLDQVYDMSMRKFIQLLAMVDGIINYTATKIGLASGMVSLPKGQTLPHWLYEKDKDMYEGLVDADDYKKQINQ